MVQDIDVLVAFLILARAIFSRHPVAIAFGVQRCHISLGFTIDHHLRQIVAGATGGGDTE